jgi:uncharacterized LabA/DUF88 family protein
MNKRGNYAFIDSQNLNLGVQKAGWKMDWRKFRRYLKEQYNVTKAYMFIGHVPEFEDLYIQMHDSGYLVVLKPTLETNKKVSEEKEQGETQKAVKGNIDAELVLYAMKELSNYQKAIIISGDGDFYCLAEYLANKNRLLHIMTPNWQYSSLLKPFDNYIIRIDQLRHQLAYRDGKRKFS